MTSLVLRSPAIEPSAARPKMTRDPLIRPGTKFLFDWSRGRCHPTGSIVAGALGANAVLPNLVDNSVNGVAVPAAFTARADGALANSGNATGIRIGSAGQFNMAADPVETVAIIWISLTTGYTTSHYTPLMRLSSDNTATNAQIWFDMGVGGRQPRCGVMGTTYTTMTDIALNTPHQLAMHYQPGGNLALYINGARVQGATGASASLTAAPAAFMEICANQIKTVFRASLCDIEASVAAETALGYNPDAILTGPQMILLDYQFGTGAIAAAPKTAFVG